MTGRRRLLPRASRLAAALLIVALAATLGAARQNRAAAQAGPASASRLLLTDQTTWVADGGIFKVGVAVTTPDLAGARLQLSVYQALTSRSDFNETLADRIHTTRLKVFDTVMAAATTELSLTVNPKASARPAQWIGLTASGVYPVQVALVDAAGGTLARLTTHLVYSGADASSARLDVAWVAPFHAPPSTGASAVSNATLAGLVGLTSQLVAHPGVALTVDATPQTVDAMANGTPAERAAVTQLAQSLGGGTRQLAAGPYVRLDLPSMLNAGLDGEIVPQLTTGTTVLSSDLHADPTGGTWIESGPLSAAALDTLAGQGVQRLVSADNTLTPLPAELLARTPAQPFTVMGKNARVAGVSVDAELASHFGTKADQLLAAHQLLADLAVVQLELPNRRGGRGVVVVPPTGWQPDATFLAAFLDGLGSAPMLAPVTVDRLFSDVTPLLSGTKTVNRSIGPADQQPRGQTISDAAAIRAARRPVASLAGLGPASTPTISEIDRRVLTSESSDLPDRSRPAELATATQLIDRLKTMVRLPGNQSITFTARQGLIPITILSSAPYPVRVRVQVTSQKLGFPPLGLPGGGCTQSGTSETCNVDLKAQNTTVRVPVVAKTAGVFSLTVALVSPDGALTLASNQDTVRSTAASGVGVFLSLGAALLLAVWWVRNVMHGRRARRLVPRPASGVDLGGPAPPASRRVSRPVGPVRPVAPVEPVGPVRRGAPAGSVEPRAPLGTGSTGSIGNRGASVDALGSSGRTERAVLPVGPDRPGSAPAEAASRTAISGGSPPGAVSPFQPGSDTLGGHGESRLATQAAPDGIPAPVPRLTPGQPPGRLPRPSPRRPPGREPPPSAVRSRGPGVQNSGGSPGTTSVSRNTAVMATGTLLSRLTGFGRVLALIWAFGISTGLTDVFTVANTAPNILYDLVLGGILSATLVPVFVEYLDHDDPAEGWRAISAVVTAITVVLLALSAVFWLLAPAIIRFYLVLNNSANAADERAIGTALLHMFVPQLFLLGGIAVTTALLNARRQFAAVAFSPVVNNLVAIVAIVAARLVATSLTLPGVRHDQSVLLILGLGTTAGYLFQFLVQVPPMFRAGFGLRPVWDLTHPAVRTVLRLSLWTFGSVVANQISFNLILVLADHRKGDVTVFNTAYQFFQLPYAIFAVSIASVITPDLSERWARRDLTGFRRQMAAGLRLTMAVLIPAAVGYLVLAQPFLHLVLHHGSFSSSDAHRIGTVVALFAIGLPGFSAYLLLMRGYQAMQDTRSMFWLYLFENAATLVLAGALYPVMGVRGLALGWVGAYTVGSIAAFGYLRRRTGGLDGRAVIAGLVRVAAATGIMILPVLALTHVFKGRSDLVLLLQVGGGAIAGAAVYLAASYAFGITELTAALPRWPASGRRR